MLGAMLSKEEVDDFMKEADVVSFFLFNNCKGTSFQVTLSLKSYTSDSH